MFELIAAGVGVGIAKHLLGAWLDEGLPNTIGGELIGKLADKLGGVRQAERAKNRILEIRDAVIEDLERFFATEAGGKADITHIAQALGRTLEAAAPTARLVEGRFASRAVANALATACPEARASLDPANQPLYDRALEATARALAAIAEKLPNFHQEIATAQLQALDQLAAQADTILSELRPIAADLRTIRDRPEKEAQGFEATYRRALRRRVTALHLFGLPQEDEAATALDLEIAYIPLRLQHTGERLPLDLGYCHILALLPGLGNRLLIEGAAGSGKTTLLQWTALTAIDATTYDSEAFTKTLVPPAPGPEFFRQIQSKFLHSALLKYHINPQNKIEENVGHFRVSFTSVKDILEKVENETRIDGTPWWRRLPVFLRLRDCPDGKLPSPDELPKIAAHEAGNAPESWLRQKLESGEALLLVDGVDEVPEANRRLLHESLDAYAAIYPKTLVVVTSRPAAVRAERWAMSFPHRLAVQPMASSDIEAFIAKWHEALAARRPKTLPHADVEGLTRQVLETPALRQLAETPLLCAAICYLNRIRRGDIPRRASRLYAAVTEQLAHQLDLDRLRQEGYERLVPALKGLDLDDKLQLLARLALAMVRAEQSSLPLDAALKPIHEGLAVLHKDHDPTAVLAALQERSGVLRGASEEVVEFAHNVLKTYLAANRLKEESANAREVLRLAEANTDPDLVLLAAILSPIADREKLIEALLDAPAPDEPTTRRRQILALRCSIEEVNSPTLRERLYSLLAEVFPPRDFDEATILADLGDRAVPHLTHRPELEASYNAASVQCLKRIATLAATGMLDCFLDSDEMAVAEELVEAVHPLRIRAVLEACSRMEPLPLLQHPHVFSAIRDLAPLEGREDIRQLNLSGTNIGDASLRVIANFKRLLALYLDGTQVTEAGLYQIANIEGLQDLSIAGTDITDVAIQKIAKIRSLQSLSIENTEITDKALEYIVDIRGLQRLSLCFTKITDEGMKQLANINGLKVLWLNDTRITDKGLQHIAGLNDLQELFLEDTKITDAGLLHVAKIKSLRVLWLTNTRITEAGLQHIAKLEALENRFLALPYG